MTQFQKLSDVADLTVGYVGTMGKEYTDTGVTFLRSLNIKPFSFDLEDIKYISNAFHNKIKKSELHTNDVVIVRTGVPGTCAVIPPELDGCNCSDLVIVRPNTKLIDPFFLCAFVNSWGRAQITNAKVGAVQKHFNVTSAEEMKIPSIPLSTQKAIAKIIQDLNNKIANNNDICSDLEAVTRLSYDYWFVQFDFPDENGKPYKSSGGKMVWNDELKREIPEGWDAKNIYDIATLETNSVFPDGNNNYYHYSIPSYDEGKMPKNENGETIASNKYKVPEKCILVSKLNPQFKRIWFVINADENSICSTEFLPLVPKNDDINHLFGVLNSDAFSVHLRQNASSSTGSRKRIDPENCLAFTFAHNNKIASMFDEKVNVIYKKINEIIAENQELTELRDFLLPMLMNRQVKIRES